MSSNTEKELLLDHYIKNYTPQNRFGFIKLVLTKHHFERYKLSDNNIKFEDLIVQDINIRNIAQNIIDQKSCTSDNFKKVFNMLNLEQIYYIGF